MGDHLVTRGRASGFIALGRGRRKKKCFSYLLLNHPPPLELIWHSSKMEARTAKPSTSTMLRKNKGLWTAYTMSIYVSFFFSCRTTAATHNGLRWATNSKTEQFNTCGFKRRRPWDIQHHTRARLLQGHLFCYLCSICGELQTEGDRNRQEWSPLSAYKTNFI